MQSHFQKLKALRSYKVLITVHIIVLFWWENVQKRRIQVISNEYIAWERYYVGDMRLWREARICITKAEIGHECSIPHCQADSMCSINIYRLSDFSTLYNRCFCKCLPHYGSSLRQELYLLSGYMSWVLFDSISVSQYQPQCLSQGWQSINIYWINKKWMNETMANTTKSMERQLI